MKNRTPGGFVDPDDQVPSYCAFLDLLGYRAHIGNDEVEINTRMRDLVSLYSHLSANLSFLMPRIREAAGSDIVMLRTFSDSIYLNSNALFPIIIACQEMYRDYYRYWENQGGNGGWHPLMRGGIAVGEVEWIRDPGVTANAHAEVGNLLTPDTRQDFGSGSNPVGPGIINAYMTAEKSYLSGMRLIVAPDVFDILFPPIDGLGYQGDISTLTLRTSDEHEYFRVSCPSEFHAFALEIILLPVRTDDHGNEVNLFEICWPADRRTLTIAQNELNSTESELTNDAQRHFDATRLLFEQAQSILQALGESAG